MEKIYAVCKTLDAGNNADKERIKKAGIQVGDKFELTNAVVFRWESIVFLEGFDKPFNSVFFDYFDKNEEEYNIYQDKRFYAQGFR